MATKEARFVQAVRLLEPGIAAWRVRIPPGGPGQFADGLLTVKIVLDGSLTLRTRDGEALRVRPGQAVLIPPGATRCVEPNRGTKTVEVIEVDVSPFRLNGALSRVGRTPRVFPLVQEGKAARFSAGFATDPLSAEGSMQCLINWWSGEPLLADLICRLAERPQDRIGQAIDRIHQEDLARLRVEGLAASVRWNRFTFCRQFVRQTGLTPKKYVKGLRFSRVLDHLIVDRTFSHHLAAKAGFPDSSYFFKAFHDFVRMSPQEYLREAKF